MAIKVLNPVVSSKIAAGEVIDRPASVVKELLENSLDAGSKHISIDIKGGGVDYIHVSDNGSGIDKKDIHLAFERYATSKVSTTLDLEKISTLGFRGEALPSIGAVANVSLISRVKSEESGAQVDVVDGTVTSIKPIGRAIGTSVTVRHLFENFPVRRKFLRTKSTEASRIQRLLMRYALAYAEVGFHLTIDESLNFSTPGCGDLRETISNVYNPQTAHEMIEIDTMNNDTQLPTISGMIGTPSLTRATRSHITLFVNGRWVQSRTLNYALEESYRGFLMERRFPIGVINIQLPYEKVDVNVHPSKTEVRFQDDGLVFSAIQQAVRHTLTTYSPVASISENSLTSIRSGSTLFDKHSSSSAHSAHKLIESRHPKDITINQNTTQEVPTPMHKESLVPRDALPALRILGQSQSTYIVAEGPDGVYLIDQHAAHERVLFEKVRNSTTSESHQVQGLIEPSTVELDIKHKEMIRRQKQLITKIGFEIEEFGDQTVIIRGVPSLLTNRDPGRSLIDFLDLMSQGGGFSTWEEKAAYSIACHGAIRAGKTLTHQEMSELIRQLELCQHPNNCPHGRPTMIHMSLTRMEREFGRR